MGGLAAFGEEGLDDGGAVGSKDIRGDFYLMVEARLGKDCKTGADGATFGVVGAVDETRHAGLDDGARAHAARLNGDVERRIGKAVVAKKAGGFAENDDFGVSCRVVVADSAISCASDDFAILNDDGSNRNFSRIRSRAGFLKREFYEFLIRIHPEQKNSTQAGSKRGLGAIISANRGAAR